MARALSSLEYVTFMDEVMPDSLEIPPWGSIVQWGGLYVLVFHLPSGEWALSDITQGIPYGSTVIPVDTYLQNFNKQQIGATDAFWFSLPENFMQVALEGAAKVEALATQQAGVAAQTVADAFQKLLTGASAGLGGALIPLAIVAAVVLVFVYGPKKA